MLVSKPSLADYCIGAYFLVNKQVYKQVEFQRCIKIGWYVLGHFVVLPKFSMKYFVFNPLILY